MSQLPTSTDRLPAVGIAASLNSEERNALCYFGEFVDHAKNAALVEQGLPQAFMHLVLEGELRVSVKSEEAIVPLGYVERGECVGELSLLEPVDASATVQANAPTRTWCISREQFDKFLEEQPVAGVKLLKAIAILLGNRLRKGSQRLLNAEADNE
ncbi:MAG: cyclic nucleotide-binding domain-containing protein [Verrucomicrobiales bacterium]|nr:cyclic nucleotide-binding domain-containing protein [Verrucomicrobiales bacterium]